MPEDTAKPKRPARAVRLLIRPDGHAVGAVEIQVGKVQGGYLVTELDADVGRRFLVEKLAAAGTAATYRVGIHGERRTCDCQGHRRHRHCKHADSLAALIDAGRL